MSLNFRWVWLHAFSGENCTIEGNLGLSDLALISIEDDDHVGCPFY